MNGHSRIHLLLVDDDLEFRRKARALSNLRFECTTVRSEADIFHALSEKRIDLILIDFGVSGESGTKLVQQLKRQGVQTPVIAMTSELSPELAGTLDDLGVKNILEKPINLDELSSRIISTLSDDPASEYTEPRVDELMISPDLYPRLFLHETVGKAIQTLKRTFFDSSGEEVRTRMRSALVYDRNGVFRGIVHLDDILRLIHPASFEHSPYMSSFTGMFMSQARNLPNKTVEDLLREQPAISSDTPIMEAVHLMLENGLINLPVLDGDEVVGVLRDKDIILEIARMLHDDE